tara:strand:+ start:269 stop:448 length:180 start_codon:yes stop_codon:yes gene_type:complete
LTSPGSWDSIGPLTERIKMDKSNMSEEFHDWLEQCPVTWSKKYGEATYTFWEEEEDVSN